MQNRCTYLLMVSLAVPFSSLGCSLFSTSPYKMEEGPIQPRMTYGLDVVQNTPPIVVRSQSGDTTPYAFGGTSVGSVSPQDNQATRHYAAGPSSNVRPVAYNNGPWAAGANTTGFPPADSYGTGAGMPQQYRPQQYSPRQYSPRQYNPRQHNPQRNTTLNTTPVVTGSGIAPPLPNTLPVVPSNISPNALPSVQPDDVVPFGFQPDGGLSTRLPDVVTGGAVSLDYPQVNETRIDILARVHEARTGRLMIGAGVNSDAGLVGSLVIDEQNFDWRRIPTNFRDIWNGKAWRGGGQRLRIEMQPGTYVERYLISFTEPYFMDTRVSLGLSAHYFDRRYFDWNESRTGGTFRLGYQFPEDWSILTSFRAEQIEIHNPRVLPVVTELSEVLGENEEYSVKVELAHDTRDNAFLPTQGHSIRIGFEQVLGTFQYPIATLDATTVFHDGRKNRWLWAACPERGRKAGHFRRQYSRVCQFLRRRICNHARL